MLKVKGYELEEPVFRDSFDRRAIKVQNNIFATLKQLNIDRDDAKVSMEKMARKKAKASVSFWFEGRNLKYTYHQMPRFIDNLYVVDKILEIYVNQLFEKEITLDQFHREFSDDDKIDEKLAMLVFKCISIILMELNMQDREKELLEKMYNFPDK